MTGVQTCALPIFIAAPKKEEAMIAYVDDASFYAEGTNFTEPYDRLRDMMTRAQGGYDWSNSHNSRFEPSKMALVGFSRKRTPDPQHPGKLAPEPQPDLHLCRDIVKPSTTLKYLGVVFDQQLHWREQVEHVTGTAAKWMLCFCRLTKLSLAFGLDSCGSCTMP